MFAQTFPYLFAHNVAVCNKSFPPPPSPPCPPSPCLSVLNLNMLQQPHLLQIHLHPLQLQVHIGKSIDANPFLFKDRLTCVKKSMYFNHLDAYLTSASSSGTCLLGLGNGCGVYFV
jgi:hypothetical protein